MDGIFDWLLVILILVGSIAQAFRKSKTGGKSEDLDEPFSPIPRQARRPSVQSRPTPVYREEEPEPEPDLDDEPNFSWAEVSPPSRAPVFRPVDITPATQEQFPHPPLPEAPAITSFSPLPKRTVLSQSPGSTAAQKAAALNRAIIADATNHLSTREGLQALFIGKELLDKPVALRQPHRW